MEPLQTDEKLATRQAPERDMDSHMLFGCSGFVASSFLTYFLAIWPFFVWLGIHRWEDLGLAFGCGFPAAFALGAVASWKFDLAGAAGFVGGIVASAIFLYLRFQQVFLEAETRRIPLPPYPLWIQWFAPGIVLASAIILAAAVLLAHKSPNKA